MTAQTDEREAKTPGALSAARRKARIFNSGYNARQAEAAATIADKDAEDIARKDEALKPFAEAPQFASANDDYRIIANITVGDLRRARAARSLT